MGPLQLQPFWVRTKLGVMAMKGYSAFPKAPGLKPNLQMLFIFHTLNANFIYPINVNLTDEPVRIYGISTLVGYLIPNSVNTNKLNS